VKPGLRLVLDLVVRLSLLFFAAWFALTPEALPQAPALARIGLSALFLVLVVIVGEIHATRTQMHLLLTVLKAKTDLASGTPPDPRAAVEILVKAMRSAKGETREKIHRQLVRLTGRDLPDSAEAWEKWWEENRETFSRPA
jgi:hypothetical protein